MFVIDTETINTYLVITDPADVIKQIIICQEAEKSATVETVATISVTAIFSGQVIKLRTNTAANSEIKAAQRIASLGIYLKDGHFSVCSKRGTPHFPEKERQN